MSEEQNHRTTPLPLSELPGSSIRAVFTDLDDTLTDTSKIMPQTLESLWTLHRRGLVCVVVSGRPAGWADCLMRTWPLDAMVFENGAGLIRREGERLITVNLAATESLAEQRAHLESIFRRLKQRFPNLKLASDQPYRLFDYAIDYCEEPPHLTDAEVEAVMQELSQDPRITHKLSSIHVNYWYGKHTKVTACQRLLATPFAVGNIKASEVLFCGDSPNDEPLFGFFPHSAGVANISNYLHRMQALPRYITAKPRGAGFQEIVQHLTRGR